MADTRGPDLAAAASDVGWKTTELQIETIVPGVLAVLGVNAASDRFLDRTLGQLVPGPEFVKVAVFVAAAYAGGLLVAVLCRVVIDGLSEMGIRALVISRFAHVGYRQLARDQLKADRLRFRADYRYERKHRRKNIAFWNAAYRSVLRTTSRKAEVDRRRSQGRVLRNLSFALAVWVPALFPHTLIWQAVGVATELVVFVSFVAPYAYWEYFNFAEAYDISSGAPAGKDR